MVLTDNRYVLVHIFHKEKLIILQVYLSGLRFITELDFEDPGEEALQTRIPNMIDNIGQILGRLAY